LLACCKKDEAADTLLEACGPAGAPARSAEARNRAGGERVAAPVEAGFRIDLRLTGRATIRTGDEPERERQK
jgi:hypothetical protein